MDSTINYSSSNAIKWKHKCWWPCQNLEPIAVWIFLGLTPLWWSTAATLKFPACLRIKRNKSIKNDKFGVSLGFCQHNHNLVLREKCSIPNSIFLQNYIIATIVESVKVPTANKKNSCQLSQDSTVFFILNLNSFPNQRLGHTTRKRQLSTEPTGMSTLIP